MPDHVSLTGALTVIVIYMYKSIYLIGIPSKSTNLSGSQIKWADYCKLTVFAKYTDTVSKYDFYLL